MANTAAAINATLYDKLSFTSSATLPGGRRHARRLRGGSPSPFLAKTLPDFIASCEGQREIINMRDRRQGASDHMAGELFAMMTGINLVHVPYRARRQRWPISSAGRCRSCSAACSVDRIYQERQGAGSRSSYQHALGCAAGAAHGQRLVPGYEASGWYGVCAPSRTPVEIVDKLNQEINAALADPAEGARRRAGGAALPARPRTSPDRRGNREVGQGSSGGEHQARVIRQSGSRIAAATSCTRKRLQSRDQSIPRICARVPETLI
jgi:hypothetical protein